MELKLSKFSSMRSNATLCLCPSEPTVWLAVYTIPHALCHQLSKQAFAEGNKKKICVKEICKVPEIQRWIFIVD